MWEWRYCSTILGFSTSWGEWSASLPGRFIPEKRATSTHWIGGWVSPQPVWTLWSRENLFPPSRIEPGRYINCFFGAKVTHPYENSTWTRMVWLVFMSVGKNTVSYAVVFCVKFNEMQGEAMCVRQSVWFFSWTIQRIAVKKGVENLLY
jgi:hypothetical protein